MALLENPQESQARVYIQNGTEMISFRLSAMFPKRDAETLEGYAANFFKVGFSWMEQDRVSGSRRNKYVLTCVADAFKRHLEDNALLRLLATLIDTATRAKKKSAGKGGPPKTRKAKRDQVSYACAHTHAPPLTSPPLRTNAHATIRAHFRPPPLYDLQKAFREDKGALASRIRAVESEMKDIREVQEQTVGLTYEIAKRLAATDERVRLIAQIQRAHQVLQG